MLPVLFVLIVCSAFCTAYRPSGVQNHRRQVGLLLFASTPSDGVMKWPDPKSAPKLDFNEDFYSVLEVSAKVTAVELKKSYYKIVFKYHPDNKEGEAAKSLCNFQMMVINNAYKVLKDANLRKDYDQCRQGSGLTGNKAVAASKRGISEPPRRADRPGDVDEDFDWEAAARENMQRDAFNGFGANRAGAAAGGGGGGGGGGDPRRRAPFGFDVDEDGNLEPQRVRQRADGQWEVEPPSPRRDWRQQQRQQDQERRTYSGSSSYSDASAGQGGGDYSQYQDLSDFLRRGGAEAKAAAGSALDDPRGALLQSTVTRLSAELQACKRRVESDRRDWGVVTDPIIIRQRLEALAGVQRLEEKLSEAEDALVDFLMRQKEAAAAAARFGGAAWGGGGSVGASGTMRSGGGGSSTSSSTTRRQQVDLWGEGLVGGDLFGERRAAQSQSGSSWRQAYERRRSGREEQEAEEDSDEDDTDEDEDGDDDDEGGRDERPDGDAALLSELEQLLRSPYGRRPPPRRR